MRPLTHDDPHAIPRNGTDVPWPDVPSVDADAGSTRPTPEAPEGPRDDAGSRETSAQRGT